MEKNEKWNEKKQICCVIVYEVLITYEKCEWVHGDNDMHTYTDPSTCVQNKNKSKNLKINKINGMINAFTIRNIYYQSKYSVY